MKRALTLASLVALAGCRETAPEAIGDLFVDRFDGPALGAHWRTTGVSYRIADGKLAMSYGYNHPLWLARRLPRDAEIRFTAQALGADGDVKVELWGDGESFAAGKGAYTSSGYVLVHGGWKNTLTVLARMDEHGQNRRARRDLRVEPGRVYRWRIVRKGGRLSWWIDETLVHELDDSEPLAGPGHAFFALSNWESDVRFDDLAIRALK